MQSDEILKIVIKYFSNLDCCAEPFTDDPGITAQDAIAQLVHDLDPHYIDWGNSHEY